MSVGLKYAVAHNYPITKITPNKAVFYSSPVMLVSLCL